MKVTKLNTGLISVINSKGRVNIYTEKEWKEYNNFFNRFKRFLSKIVKLTDWYLKN